VLIVPFLAELWLECAAILLIWLVVPVLLVAKQKIGAAAVMSVVVSIVWIAVSIILFNESGRARWAMRDGQTWISLLWLTSAVGTMSSIALSSVLLIAHKHMQINNVKVTK
jgi:hypothetical protein